MKARLKPNSFGSICYNKIFSGKEQLLKNCKKNRKLFELDFRSLPRSSAFTSKGILESMLHNFNILSIIHENFKCLFLPVKEKRSGQNDLSKITKSSIFRNRKWRNQNTKGITAFYNKSSDVKISWKWIEAFSRNPRTLKLDDWIIFLEIFRVDILST